MKTLFLLFTIFLFLSLNGSAQAGTYYVAKTGDDANPGSEAQPWLSIQKAPNSVLPVIRFISDPELITKGLFLRIQEAPEITFIMLPIPATR